MVQEEGVNVITNAELENVEKVNDQLILSLNNGRKASMVQTFMIKHYLVCHMCMKFLGLPWYNVYTRLEKLCEVILAKLEVYLPHQI
jgi:hypothetical protein